GNALMKKGAVDAAIASYREAIRREPSLALAHHNLGNVLMKKGAVDAAIASYREAIRREPDYFWAHCSLAEALLAKGALDEVLVVCKKALRLKPDQDLSRTRRPEYHFTLLPQGDVRAKPNHARVYFYRGAALEKKGEVAEAVAAYQEAIRLKP